MGYTCGPTVVSFQIPPLKDTAPERRESKWALGGYVQSCSVAIERGIGIQAAEPTGDTKLGTARCHRCQISVMSKGSWNSDGRKDIH